jgi:tetratricopeptide (TPR) repeat protein
MRTLGLWLAATTFLAAAAQAPADEPHLDMIRGLRAAGEPELALQYMEEQLPKNLPPQIQQVIGLELARTRVEVARAESEEGKRLALFAAARGEFEKFLAANPKHELAPQARFEIARLIAAQGKELLNRARRAQGEAQARALKDARPLFEAARTQLKDAGKQLKEQLDAFGEPMTAQQKTAARDLTQSWLTAQFEEAMELYLLAQTYADATGADKLKPGALLTDAGKVFEKLADVDAKQPICWLSRAWLARCYFENQDFPKATDQLDKIRADRTSASDDGRRVAEYFRVLMGRSEGSTAPMPLATQLGTLQTWLERYRGYQHTTEGCGARFTLADVLEKQAFAIKGGIETDAKGRPTKVTADAAALLKQAEKHLRFLTEFENDFTERAATKRMRLILAIAIRETPDRDPAKLMTFENCYLLALLENAELNEEIKEMKSPDNTEDSEKQAEKLADLQKKHYSQAVKALERAMKLVQPSDPPKEVQDARVMQVYANLRAGNPYEAAVLGEHLAKQMTKTSRGAVPALYALQAYRAVMMETKAAGASKEADLQTDREQVRRMATFMEATWPNDTPTDTARHTLGTLYFSEGDFVKALETYARVTPNYVSMPFLRHEQAIACFNLQRNAKVPAPVRRQWFDRIVALLEQMPDMGRGADNDLAYAYCLARLRLGDLLLQEGKQYARIEDLGKAIMGDGEKFALDPKREVEVRYNAQALKLYGLYGRVYELVKAHNLTEASKLYLPALAELQKNKIPDDESAARARKAATDLVQLSLRASVQEGDIDRAQTLLKQLQEVSTSKDGGNSSAPLVAVLKEVQAQIAELRKTDPNRLKDTIDKFTNFLEALAKQPNLARDVKIFLAQGFSSLDQPARAIELLGSISAPAEKDPGAPPKEGDDNAKTKYDAAKAAYDTAWKPYWFAQLTHVRALRQAGRLAENKGDKTKYFGNADRLIDEMIGTPQKQGWAFNSLEVRREKIFLLEDQEQWQNAMSAWVQMQKPFSKFSTPPKDERESRIRAAYYEVRFYMVRLVCKSKGKLKDPKKKEADLKKLAEQIVKDERDPRTSDFGGASVKKLYQEWLEDEPDMRKAYEAVGGKALLPGGDATP